MTTGVGSSLTGRIALACTFGAAFRSGATRSTDFTGAVSILGANTVYANSASSAIACTE